MVWNGVLSRREVPTGEGPCVWLLTSGTPTNIAQPKDRRRTGGSLSYQRSILGILKEVKSNYPMLFVGDYISYRQVMVERV